MEYCLLLLPLFAGWLLDKLLGDPLWLPHPVVAFGRTIAALEHRLNHGRYRFVKGLFTTLFLVSATFGLTALLLQGARALSPWLQTTLEIVLIFFCLAGTTLIREVKAVFRAVDRSLDEGRRQVARIVGRDTQALSAQEVRTAALETLAENLSDGVIAPLFWLALLGVPGMMMYKMINTLDSMIGYRNERYRDFGCVAARLDDVANYLPARLTAILMILSAHPFRHWAFVKRYGQAHASPNSGYPEAALASILDCRFGGPHPYFGQMVWKAYIGHHDRPLTTPDLHTAVRINQRAEILMILLVAALTVGLALG